MATQRERPDWLPLQALVSDGLLARFMWMFEIQTAQGAIHAYKHIDTRRYLYLDASGGAYGYLGADAYSPLAPSAALRSALSPLWEHPDTPFEELADAWEALNRAAGRERG